MGGGAIGVMGARRSWRMRLRIVVVMALTLTAVPAVGSLPALAAAPWVEQAELGHDTPAFNEGFGWSVAVDGNLAVVGGQKGRAQVYFRNQSGVWVLEQIIVATAPAGALAVAVSEDPVKGDTVVIGNASSSVGATFAGAVIVYGRDEFGNWVAEQTLVSDDIAERDRLGFSVAMDGDTIIAGANEEDGAGGDDRGAAYVFTRDSSRVWTQQAVLRPSDLDDLDEFGTSVDVSGDRAIVGGPLIGTENAGAAYVYERTGSAWAQDAKLVPIDTAAFLQFGIAVGISGETAVIGTQAFAFKAYAFRNDGVSWFEEATLVPASSSGRNGFGLTVAIDGNTAAIGAPLANAAGVLSSGAAWIFGRTGSVWTVESGNVSLELEASDASANFAFGWSVAVEGSTAVVGSLRHDENADGFSTNGNAYVFAGSDYVYVDQRAPAISGLLLVPSPASPDEDVVVSATADDSAAGNSTVTGAEYQVDGGAWLGMVPVDGSFDSSTEGVTATISGGSFAGGSHNVCVRATDSAGNAGSPVCEQFQVQAQQIPLTATITIITNFSPILDPTSEPDFYARVFFADATDILPFPDLPDNRVDTSQNLALIEPFWEYTGDVSDDQDTAQIVVEVWDADPSGDPDDKTDVNPAAGVDRLFVNVDLATGRIAGTSTAMTCSRGDTASSVEVCVTVGLGNDHDLDDDGLLNGWELFGVDMDGDGTVDLDLPGWGADPMHKDLFVEYDYISFQPGVFDLQNVKDAFALAPIDAGGTPNPDGLPGINLHIDTRGVDDLGGGTLIDDPIFCGLGPEFYVAKADHFDPMRRWVFRYAISAPATPADGCSGGQGEIGGNDFVNNNFDDDGTFMHELGHNLGQLHGGDNSDHRQPNYVSVMNYNYQFGIARNDGSIFFDYSPARNADDSRPSSLLPDIDEGSLDETISLATDRDYRIRFVNGACAFMGSSLDGPVDWDGDGDPDDAVALASSLDTDPTPDSGPPSCPGDATDEVHSDFDNWSAISLPFRQDGDSADGAINPSDDDDLPTTEEIAKLTEMLATTDLAISISHAPEPADSGGEVTVEVAVVNLGPNPADAVVVTITPASGLSLASAPTGCALVVDDIRCDRPVLNLGATDVFDVVLSIADDASGSIDVSGSVENELGPDTDKSNNSTSTSVTVETTNPDSGIDLSIVKTFAPATLTQGETGVFSIVVSNAGLADAGEVIVEDQVNGALEVTQVVVSSGSGTCTDTDSDANTVECVIDIPSEESATVTVTYIAAPSLPENPIFDTASGSEFRIIFFSGSILEGSTDGGPVLLDGIDVTGEVSIIRQLGTNDILFDPPGDDSAFLIHLSCSDRFIDGWGEIGGPDRLIDVNWRIASYSVTRYNHHGFIKSCGDTPVPFSVPNTATATGTDSDGTRTVTSTVISVEIVDPALVILEDASVGFKNRDVFFKLVSANPHDMLITQIGLTWPEGNGALTRIRHGTTTIWTGTETGSAAMIFEGDFIGVEGWRILEALEKAKLRFTFENSPVADPDFTEYTFVVTFADGTEVPITTTGPEP